MVAIAPPPKKARREEASATADLTMRDVAALVRDVTEEVKKSQGAPREYERCWAAHYTEKMVKLCKVSDGDEKAGTRDAPIDLPQALRFAFIDEPGSFADLIACIEHETLALSKEVLRRRKSNSLHGMLRSDLPKDDVGVRFDQALQSPRAWQTLTTLFMVILYSPHARRFQSWRGERFLKLDVCPAAGKTFATTWVACLVLRFQYAETVTCIAGGQDCVKAQWLELLQTVLPSKHVVTTFQGLDKLRRARPGTFTVVDEAHHASERTDAGWGASVKKIAAAFDNPTLLLTGTDFQGQSILSKASLLLRLPYAVALEEGWVRQVEVHNLTQNLYLEGVAGEVQLERERLYLSVIPPKPNRSSGEQWEQFKKTVFPQALSRAICAQYHESLRVQNSHVGKIMVFLQAETQQIKQRLERTGWPQLGGMKQLCAKVFDAAVGVAEETLKVRLTPARHFWAENGGNGLDNFRQQKKCRDTQVFVCFAKGQGGEGFDDPPVNTILFVLSAKTELRSYQTVTRAVRPCGKQPQPEKALIFCVDEGDERYDDIQRQFAPDIPARAAYAEKIYVQSPSDADLKGVTASVLPELAASALPELAESVPPELAESAPEDVSAPSAARETRGSWKTSRHFQVGVCGRLPVRMTRDTDVRREFEREARRDEMKEMITFEAGRAAEWLPASQWAHLSGLFRRLPIPQDQEHHFLNIAAALPPVTPSMVRSFASDNLASTLRKLRNSVVEIHKLKYDDLDDEERREEAEDLIRETWRHWGAISHRSPGPTFLYEEVLLGCFRCGFESPSWRAALGVFRSASASPCWCESVQCASERELDIWQAVYIPCRIQYLLDESAGPGVAPSQSLEHDVSGDIAAVQALVRDRLRAQ
jgi:hypothetical protein